MTVKKLVYKIYNHDCLDIRQETTTVDVSNVLFDNIYSYAERVIHDRFPGRISIKFNHAGKTISIKPLKPLC